MKTTLEGLCVVCGHPAHGDHACRRCHCAASPLKHPQGKKPASTRPKKKAKKKAAKKRGPRGY